VVAFLAIRQAVQHGLRYLFQQRLLRTFPSSTTRRMAFSISRTGKPVPALPCGYGQQLAIFNHRANFIPDSGRDDISALPSPASAR
jgi:hypothetical protein